MSIVKFKTSNGEMSIVAERFFPATKKDLKRLKKSIVDPVDTQKFHDAIGNMIAQIETYAKGCKAREEIHEMAMREEIVNTFAFNAEGRTRDFYRCEWLRAHELIVKLKENQEGLLHG